MFHIQDSGARQHARRRQEKKKWKKASLAISLYLEFSFHVPVTSFPIHAPVYGPVHLRFYRIDRSVWCCHGWHKNLFPVSFTSLSFAFSWVAPVQTNRSKHKYRPLFFSVERQKTSQTVDVDKLTRQTIRFKFWTRSLDISEWESHINQLNKYVRRRWEKKNWTLQKYFYCWNFKSIFDRNTRQATAESTKGK